MASPLSWGERTPTLILPHNITLPTVKPSLGVHHRNNAIFQRALDHLILLEIIIFKSHGVRLGDAGTADFAVRQLLFTTQEVPQPLASSLA
jgi:hypothetical protein